jgi:hypothetical protein
MKIIYIERDMSLITAPGRPVATRKRATAAVEHTRQGHYQKRRQGRYARLRPDRGRGRP